MPRCHTCLTSYPRVRPGLSPRVHRMPPSSSVRFCLLCFCRTEELPCFFFFLYLLHRCPFAIEGPMASSLRTKSFGFGEGGAEVVGAAFQWWNEIDESDQWQRGIYYALCAAYASVSFVALVRDFLSFPRKIFGFLVNFL